MKKIIKTVLFITAAAMIITSFTSCGDKNEYTPTGELYIKTAPSRGDTGVEDVISIEAVHKAYKGDGDITVPMTVGFGHLPGAGGYSDDVQDTFYVQYQVFKEPWSADNKPVWQRKVEYSDSWYDSKYDSTEQNNPPSLLFARYGEFYPLYKETVELVFPADVEKGYAKVGIVIVVDGEVAQRAGSLRFYFERVDGVLTLEP